MVKISMFLRETPLYLEFFFKKISFCIKFSQKNTSIFSHFAIK